MKLLILYHLQKGSFGGVLIEVSFLAPTVEDEDERNSEVAKAAQLSTIALSILQSATARAESPRTAPNPSAASRIGVGLPEPWTALQL